ncbi:MAG: PKD domain-containing protein [Ferruginibacter sp.]|nr:PKD domain-containing protein [Ferruginibacter sp.]
MKKIFTLLWLTLAAFTFKATAQTTPNCNPDFAVQYLTNFTVKFNPAITNDSPFVRHFWSFGDGTTGSQLISPTHTYALPGSYAVVHTVLRVNPNNVPVCTQTLTKTVVISQPCNLVVDFSWTSTAANPLTLAFQNLSVPLAATDSVRWTFGDGTSSLAVNPTHTYTAPGTYTVCLRVKKNGNVGSTTPCVREICKTVVVQSPCNMVPNFTWTATASNPLRIEFQNTSTNTVASDSILWTFGDGTSSNQFNPVHIYAAPGTYTVCLKIIRYNGSNTPCIKQICKTIVVQGPPPCNLVVNFTSQPDTAHPLRIKFTNTSTPINATDSVRWTFGDGTSVSGLQSDPNVANPTHIYVTAGSYTVCLRIKKNSNISTPTQPVCVREKCNTVVVTAPCNLVVNFTSQPDSNNHLRIKFTNTSTPVAATDSLLWIFGDGTTLKGVQGNPNVANPVHTYANAGTYNVCLYIKKHPGTVAAPCVRSTCRTITIQQPCNLVVNFTSQPDPNNPLRIKFTNTSVPVSLSDSLRWTFGDGTSLSGVQSDPNVANPTHIYTTAGAYTVCLRIKKNNSANTPTTPPCVREKCNTILVTVPCNLVVNFTSQPDPAHPLRIKFTNTSTPINATDSVRWTFGDGTSVSGLQTDPNVANPTHIYANAGSYTVCLRVKKNSNIGTPTQPVCVREKCNTIVVTPPCNFPVSFSWHLDSLNPRKVHFTNLSAPPTPNAFAVWSFGDGTTATTWNAVHEYAQPGTYIVCLRVYSGQNTTCFRESCDTIVVPVPVPPCTQLSKFHYQVFPNDNQKYKFTPDYINPTFQYIWTFGDGTGSHDPVATHRYAQPGTYTACLTVWRSNQCASTTCHQITVLPQINCDTAHVGYTFVRSTTMANKIQFFANATLPILDQVWFITKLGDSTPVILHQNNPLYTFQDTGMYRVCLKATLQGGCVKEYCSNIYIGQLSNICELQAFPNPASAVTGVNLVLTQPQMINIVVFNHLNMVVMQQTQQGHTGNNIITLNVSNLPAGQYTIRLIYGNNVCIARFQKL